MRTSSIACLAAGAGLAASAAAAQVSDPLVRRGQLSAPPGEFYLNSQDAREIIHYSSPRDVRLCLPRRTDASAPPAKDVPLKITWDDATAVLAPGNCLFFDASRVSVSPAAPLPSGVSLHGSVETAQALR
ncbi:MAG: hypothetical protein ACK4YQ_09655 [Phenylobacterium sp.]|uniref:hypothetical protein n=1 Tax=Phenylobacterium sp. TaxID=1871053 RepID=UPI0039199071